jgi:hypothetical protein
MIRRAIYTLFAISALMLGGCATTGGTTSATIVQIQQAAVVACGFLPTVSTVANILVAPTGPAGVAVSMTVEAIAGAICQAVTAKSMKKGGAAPTVYGVPIHGQFTR